MSEKGINAPFGIGLAKTKGMSGSMNFTYHVRVRFHLVAEDEERGLHVVDAQFGIPNGLTLYGAYLGRYTRHNGGAIGTNGGATGAAATHRAWLAASRSSLCA